MERTKKAISKVAPIAQTKSAACIPAFNGFSPHLSEQTVQLGKCNFSLKSVLHNTNEKDPLSRHRFEEFLKGELAEEHLEFWCDTSYVLEQGAERNSTEASTEPCTEKLKSMDPKSDAVDFLKERYIKPQSEKEINIDHGTREGILTAEPDKTLPQRLEAAVREVESPLFDSFRRYLKIVSRINLSEKTARGRKFQGILAFLVTCAFTAVLVFVQMQNTEAGYLRVFRLIPSFTMFFAVEKTLESRSRL